jgi:hypothetical protein
MSDRTKRVPMQTPIDVSGRRCTDLPVTVGVEHQCLLLINHEELKEAAGHSQWWCFEHSFLMRESSPRATARVGLSESLSPIPLRIFAVGKGSPNLTIRRPAYI